jgi:S1-C subfamily serine protease
MDEGVVAATDTPTAWLGAQIKSITTDGEVSAAGLSEKAGVLFLDVPRESPAAKAGFEKLDVILAAEGRPIRTVADLLSSNARSLRVMRNQSEIKVDLP